MTKLFKIFSINCPFGIRILFAKYRECTNHLGLGKSLEIISEEALQTSKDTRMTEILLNYYHENLQKLLQGKHPDYIVCWRDSKRGTYNGWWNSSVMPTLNGFIDLHVQPNKILTGAKDAKHRSNDN